MPLSYPLHRLVHGCAQRKGKPATAEYRAWSAIKSRCTSPSNKDYARYGGRGITVFPEWLSDFQAFLAYVGPRPAKGYSLDRIDNDKGYEPGNVRWATATEQRHNRGDYTPGFCRRGHDKNGRVNCRICGNISWRAYADRKRNRALPPSPAIAKSPSASGEQK